MEPLTLHTIPDLVAFVNQTRANYFYELEDTNMISSVYPSKDLVTGEILPI